ncbi:hypothetical protein EP7_002610 [Isosphaeraceae bacterium EP7]
MTEDVPEPIPVPAPAAQPPRMDWVALAMTAVIVLSLARFAWVRWSPGARPNPPIVGKSIPPLSLRDPSTAEPLVWVTPRDRVTWLTFYSATDPAASADLAVLESTWHRFRQRAHFAMLAVAANPDQEPAVARLLAQTKATLPTAVATQSTLATFDADRGTLPLHLILDTDGTLLAIARGRPPGQLERLTETVTRRLAELDPTGGARFAHLAPSGS